MTRVKISDATRIWAESPGALFPIIVGLLSLLLGAQGLLAESTKPGEESTEQIISRLGFDGSGVRQMTMGNLHGQTELFLFEPAKGRVVMINATDPAKPVMESEYKTGSGTQPTSLRILNGNRALLLSAPQTGEAETSPESLTLLNVSNPRELRVLKQFQNVLAYAADDSTGLLYLVTPRGLTVVSEPSILSESARAWNEFVQAR